MIPVSPTVDVMGNAVEQSASEPFEAEDLGPFLEGQVAGHQRRCAFVTLTEGLEQQLGAPILDRNFYSAASRRYGDATWSIFTPALTLYAGPLPEQGSQQSPLCPILCLVALCSCLFSAVSLADEALIDTDRCNSGQIWLSS
jgi:hypothetical protein